MASNLSLEVDQLLARRHLDREGEARLLELLAAAGACELNELLARLDWRRVVAAVDDRLFGPDNLQALRELLSVRRLAELSLQNRARLVTALQHGRTCADDERAVAAVLLGTRGEALTALKNAIDAGGDEHDLQQLVFCDLDDEPLRERLLAYFLEESRAASRGALKVLSDVDDTLYASWKDERFPKKTVYPGVRQFYRELSGGEGSGPVFVTARPGPMEEGTLQMLRGLQVEGAVTLTGDVAHWVGNERIARRKFQNFAQYRRLFPEYGFVWIGDSGQGDILLGRRMLAECPEGVKAVFIHDVVQTPERERETLRAERILLFDTYAGAALEAWRLGLVGCEGLERVARAAGEELERVAFTDEAQRREREAELRRDLEVMAACVEAGDPR